MSRVVVSGAAGFLGSHMVELLVARGDEVVAVDNLVTGDVKNLAGVRDQVEFVQADVCEPLEVAGPVDVVMHMASPASPRDYLALPLETLRVGSVATDNLLQLAQAKGARFFITSTSEVYGDPEVHPQTEAYWGRVNPIGPRSVYDEAKRFAEAMTMAYHRTFGVEVRLARIFNTYGPRMRPEDGRVVSNFIVQALTGKPLTIYGDGSQTRSFCYVDDEVRGLLALADSDYVGPMNIGNPNEFTVKELAEIVLEETNSKSELVFEPLPQDDPTQRQPDITLARQVLGWSPSMALRDGVRLTAEWFEQVLRD